MSKEVLQNIIDDFSVDKFQLFFRRKSNKFRFPNEPIYEESENFTDGLKIAEAKFEDGKLIVCAFLSKQDLSERSGKKAQYEIGKKILRYTDTDAGIFIFYDAQGSFRFSLIYANYLGRRRDFSNFRRFTYFVSRQLTNKTFLQRIGEGDFSTLGKIKDAFSVEKVTKEFYQEIANWYFWAVRESKFPPDAEAEDNGRNIAVIRLITRMIFIWFMKVRQLIPDDLFKEDKIKDILNDISRNKSTYYKAILQNLFFATLSTEIKERRFREPKRYNKGWNKDFAIQYVYRFHGLFKDSSKIEEYFKKIPFLNGGLFECLDNGRKNIYIDGFTERKKYQPYVPNFLFFQEEREIDLNEEYGTKGKKYKVRGLINILSSYNFTIDENEPDDLEVALDPELLGRVFENLLASYNPETATTARKATGSYYTPREIVDYMVTQSLKYYFKTHLSDIPDIEEKLSQLFSKENYDNPFDSLTTKKLISLIESLRVVDPAVGSGAFPMGILNKLVFILSKLDPQNTLWKEAQIEAIKRDVKDPILKEKLIQQAEKYFKNKDINYLRKLYLIEKCIYGVDIQQIAVEIAKLRFFISLLVDEKIDKTKPNWGIEPLPNLDFKLMQGNSLISSFAGIDFEKKRESENKGQLSLGFTSKYDNLIKEFEEIKNQYQNEPDKDKKDKLRGKIEELILQIFEEKIAQHFPQLKRIEEKYKSITDSSKRAEFIAKEKTALYKKLGFDLEQAQKDLIAYTEGRKPKNFFLWDVYFAEVFTGDNPGFDIVITNPPYVRQEKIKEQKRSLQRVGYEVYNSTSDLYTYFYEKSYQILREGGFSCFISSNKWMRAKYGENLRRFLKEKTEVMNFIDFGGYSVFDATVDTNIILFKKKEPYRKHKMNFVNVRNQINGDLIEYIEKTFNILHQSKLSDNAWILVDERTLRLKEKIECTGRPLKKWDVKIYRGVITGFNKAFIIETQRREEILRNCRTEEERKLTNELIRSILRGRDIGRYYYRWDDLWLVKIESGWTNKNRRNRDPEKFIKSTLPSIYEHLISFADDEGKGKGLLNRDDQGDYWWELRDCNYYHEFEKEKIVYPDISTRLSFTYDNEYFLNNTCYFINSGSKYLLSVLNSSLLNVYYRQISSQLGDEAIRAFTIFIEQLPIPPITRQNQNIAKELENLVNKILSLTQSEDYLQNPQKQAKVKEYERQIDQLVYKLYGLTKEEIKIIEETL